MKQMTSNSSYLLRAYYDWISDNLLTPYVVVDTTFPDVHVPTEYIENDKIVLNILSTAVKSLEITPEAVSFQARFAGVVYDIWLPIRSICSIYAQENGIGFMFGSEFDLAESSSEADELIQEEQEWHAKSRDLEIVDLKESDLISDISKCSSSKHTVNKKKKFHLKVVK
mgnify:CR=1 FL=1|tara:strand:+ start:2906 stop:3412 length:507 start_codon:yes stop_codon:yes gene_type:complete